jgi:hypothetical protein
MSLLPKFQAHNILLPSAFASSDKEEDEKMHKGFKDIENYFLGLERASRAQQQKKSKKIKELTEEVERLKKTIKELESENQKLRENIEKKVELFLEIALNSVSNFAVKSEGFRILFSRKFRKDFLSQVSDKPFVLDTFIQTLSEVNSKSLLLKSGSKQDLFELPIETPYGVFSAVYVKIEPKVLKFVFFGERELVKKEVESGENVE